MSREDEDRSAIFGNGEPFFFPDRNFDIVTSVKDRLKVDCRVTLRSKYGAKHLLQLPKPRCYRNRRANVYRNYDIAPNSTSFVYSSGTLLWFGHIAQSGESISCPSITVMDLAVEPGDESAKFRTEKEVSSDEEALEDIDKISILGARGGHFDNINEVSIRAIKYSPDGRYVAIALSAATLLYFRVSSSGLKDGFSVELEPPSPIKAISWSSNGELLLVGCSGKVVMRRFRSELWRANKTYINGLVPDNYPLEGF